MQLKNTPVSYGAVTKSFHWVMALLMIGMLCLGFYMDGVEELTSKIRLYGLHKSIGVTVLAFVILRILWHLWSQKPAYVESLKPLEKKAAHFLHFCLYGAMLGMPLSGWLMSSAAGRSVSFFGLFTLPDLVTADDSLRGIFGTLHFYMAWALVAAIAVHLCAALKHHFFDKDATLRRMLPFCLALLISAPAYGADAKWDVIPEESSLTYTGKVMNKEFTGSFKIFTPEIYFDPTNPGQSKISVTVDIASLDSGDAERDTAAKGRDFFKSEEFPTAKFESQQITKISDDGYVAAGTLTIRNTSLPVTLPFTLVLPKNGGGKQRGIASGEIVIDRSTFQLGQGEWADTSMIANDIRISFKVAALRQNP
jgi:cytochrome b561